MHKWRPSYKAIYVIPEVHGNIASLERILNRILPLRSHTGQEDMLIFLGDYIDGDPYGADVIEAILTIKKEYGERIVCLKGNHEDLFLQAIMGVKRNFDDWIAKGGQRTIGGYLEKFGYDRTIESVASSELKDIIPQSHIDFLNDLESFHILDEYFFMHGSFNPNKIIAENDLRTLIWDESGSKYVKEQLKKGSIPELKDDYIFIGAHNYKGTEPYIYQRYMMLGGGAPEKLYVLDLNSMQCSRASSGKERIYPFKLNVVE
jgi:predicted MPP superfamily phosphohydrolase